MKVLFDRQGNTVEVPDDMIGTMELKDRALIEDSHFMSMTEYYIEPDSCEDVCASMMVEIGRHCFYVLKVFRALNEINQILVVSTAAFDKLKAQKMIELKKEGKL